MTKEIAGQSTEAQRTSDREQLQQQETRFSLNPLGAHLETLTINGLPLLVPVERGDKPGEMKATHPCTPIFGSEGKQSRSNFGITTQHGQARHEHWQVLKNEPDLVSLYYPIHDGNYMSGISVTQTATLKDDIFSLETQHENKGSAAAPVNFAEHFYFNTPIGWEGIQINDQDVSGLLLDDKPIPHVINFAETNSILIPGFPQFFIEQTGLPYAVLWVGGNSLGQKDQHYITIEPCEGDPFEMFFGSEESLIQPATCRNTALKIHL